MKAIAQRTPEPVFLVETTDGRARIVDTDAGTVSQEQVTDSFVKWGEWNPVDDSDGATAAMNLIRSMK